MGKISPVNNILHVDANLCVESNALVYRIVLAVKNIVGMFSILLARVALHSSCLFSEALPREGVCMIHVVDISGVQKAVKIGSVGATVQRVNAEVGNAHALLLDENVIQMFAEIVGLGNECEWKRD